MLVQWPAPERRNMIRTLLDDLFKLSTEDMYRVLNEVEDAIAYEYTEQYRYV